MTLDLDALLGAARRTERTVPVCLRGDLVAQLQDLQRDLEEAERERGATTASLADGSRSRVLAEQIEQLRETMRENTLHLTLRSLSRHEFTALKLAHPPRKDDDRDKVMGFNEESFFDALVRACAVEPAMTGDQWQRLNEVISDGQWQVLVNAAWAVNARDVDVPFSSAASRVMASSGEG